MFLGPNTEIILPLQLGLDMEELQEIEEDAGLGNGGLGRLAGWHQRRADCDTRALSLGGPKFLQKSCMILPLAAKNFGSPVYS